MKQIHLFLILVAFFSSICVRSDVLHTFYGSVPQVNCGESGGTRVSYLRQEVGVNEEFAVALGWPISFNGNARYFERRWEVLVSSLNTDVHAAGGGGGYNRTGKKLIIYRNLMYSEETDTYYYQYHSQEETYYDNKPCVHNE